MVIYTSKINEKLKNTDDFLLSSENKILNQIDECAKGFYRFKTQDL